MMIDADARPGAERVLAAVRDASGGVEAGAGVTAAELAALLGLHVTTVRFHLERLTADGRVAGHAVASGGRGRPHVVYQAVLAPDARAGMLAALADAAAGDGPAGARAQLAGEVWAGEVWAQTLDLGGRGAIGALTEVFAQLGFAPEPAEGGIALRACPFLDDARRHPEVVCGVHRGLAVGIARRADAAVDLMPFRGNLCVLAVAERRTVRA